MKRINVIIFWTLLYVLSLYRDWWLFAQDSYSLAELKAIANITATQFINETWYDDSQCSVDWTQVPLGAIIYGKILQEWGYKSWTVGHTTNNRWSLRKNYWLRANRGTRYADRSYTWQEYSTVEDWLIELAKMYTDTSIWYNCTVSYKALFAYIMWPRANPNDWYITWMNKWQYVHKILSTWKNWANEYTGSFISDSKTLLPVWPSEANNEIEDIKNDTSENLWKIAKDMEATYRQAKEAKDKAWRECVSEWVTCK